MAQPPLLRNSKVKVKSTGKIAMLLPVLLLVVAIPLISFFLDKNIHDSPKNASEGKSNMDMDMLTMKSPLTYKILNKPDSSINNNINLKTADTKIKEISNSDVGIQSENNEYYIKRLDDLEKLFNENRYDQILDSIKRLESTSQKLPANLIEKKVSFNAKIDLKIVHSQNIIPTIFYKGTKYKFLLQNTDSIDFMSQYNITGYIFRDKLIVTSVKKISNNGDINAQEVGDNTVTEGTFNLYLIAVNSQSFPLYPDINTQDRLESHAKNIQNFFSTATNGKIKFNVISKIVQFEYDWRDCIHDDHQDGDLIKAAGLYGKIKEGDFVQFYRSCDSVSGESEANLDRSYVVLNPNEYIGLYTSTVRHRKLNVAYHELAHNFFFLHSGGFLNCKDPINDQCTDLREYNDKTGEVLSGNSTYMSFARRDVRGWLTPKDITEIKKGESKTYSITQNYINSKNGLRAVKMTVEPSLYDQRNYAPGNKVKYYIENYNGVLLIHMLRPWGVPLKDGTYIYHGDDVVLLNGDRSDGQSPGLRSGETFYDKINNITIKFVSGGLPDAVVSVNYNSVVSTPVPTPTPTKIPTPTPTRIPTPTPTSIPTTPTPSSEIIPADGSIITFPVTFTWTPGTSALYIVQMGTAKGTSNVFTNYINKPTYTYSGSNIYKGKTLHLKVTKFINNKPIEFFYTYNVKP